MTTQTNIKAQFQTGEIWKVTRHDPRMEIYAMRQKLKITQAHAGKLAEALRGFVDAYKLQSDHDLECAEALATQALAESEVQS